MLKRQDGTFGLPFGQRPSFLNRSWQTGPSFTHPGSRLCWSVYSLRTGFIVAGGMKMSPSVVSTSPSRRPSASLPG